MKTAETRKSGPGMARWTTLVVGSLAMVVSTGSARADTWVVSLQHDRADGDAPPTRQGRLVLMLVPAGLPELEEVRPIEGPYLDSPHPVASIPVSGHDWSEPLQFHAAESSWPTPLDQLDGRYRVQAVMDMDSRHGTHLDPGNIMSNIVEVELSADGHDRVELSLQEEIPRTARPEGGNITWIERPSPMLQSHLGHEAGHRAAVVLPMGYDDVRHPRRFWPTIYVVPAAGRRDAIIEGLARLNRQAESVHVIPGAVWVILDPESPQGYHGFADTGMHGPRATALVEELIPWLHQRFRLVDQVDARIVTGHSDGGWSALWLQMNHPDVFGACFSSAPHPIDFSAMGTIDLYEDESLFVDGTGKENPRYRMPVGPLRDRVLMTTREELGMQHGLSPDGRSGMQWDTWTNMFSRTGPGRTGRPVFDQDTGLIDRDVVLEDWSRYDIVKLLDRNRDELGPIMLQRARIVAGERDSFYGQEAARNLAELLGEIGAELESDGSSGGYVLLDPEADHEDIVPRILPRWHTEMRKHLAEGGHQD